jgi:integrase
MLSKNDEFLEEWLREFKSKSTRKVYRAGIRDYAKKLNIEDLENYVKDSPEVVEDIRRYLNLLDGKPSKTVSTYVGAVKVFLQDKGVKVPDEAWKKIRRRGYMPKRVRAETRDKKPTKTELKRLLNYTDVKGKALILFLVSSGARIGETLRLKIEDFNFDADPPSVHIIGQITKGGVGERTAYFSYEAKDAIRDWLAIKDSMGKRDGTNYKDDRVFPFVSSTANDLFNRACDKAGIGTRDKRTGRRVIHLHSLRKFFRTKIGLDLDMTHALMGHSEYLDQSYLRQEQGEVAKAYLEAMPNVSVYEVASNQELKTQSENLEDENQKLKDKVASIEQEMQNMKALMNQILQALPNTA